MSGGILTLLGRRCRLKEVLFRASWEGRQMCQLHPCLFCELLWCALKLTSPNGDTEKVNKVSSLMSAELLIKS
jgi:hypothetical protein